MRKRIVIVLGVFIICAFTVVFKCYFGTLEKDKTVTSVLCKVTREGNLLDLGEIVSGNWNQILLIGPYTEKEDVKKNTGIDVRKIKNYYSDTSEETIIVFCKDSEIEKYILTSDLNVSFNWDTIHNISSYNLFLISRENAKFLVASDEKYLSNYTFEYCSTSK